jgi:2-amino-4-hydroxy-6-hydroxymethyldihydropteridine diphosphokinase
MSDVGTPLEVELPTWANVSKKRRKHIVRVTVLLDSWARALNLSAADRQTWIDAGRYHDALRDASVDELRELAGSSITEVELLHGPAAAARMARDGESRQNLLDAIRYHSIGSEKWDRVGKALYMADYLEPGRKFDRERRAQLAELVPLQFDDAFRQVVAARMEYARVNNFTVYPESTALLESLK